MKCGLSFLGVPLLSYCMLPRENLKVPRRCCLSSSFIDSLKCFFLTVLNLKYFFIIRWESNLHSMSINCDNKHDILQICV